MGYLYDDKTRFAQKALTAQILINDLSVAAQTFCLKLPACKVNMISHCLGGTIAAANKVLTITNVALAMGAITVAYSGSAAGQIAYIQPANSVFNGTTDYLKIVTSGGSTGAVPGLISIEYEELGAGSP